MFINGKSPEIRSKFQIDAAQRYSDIIVCKEMGWSEKQLLETSVDFYEDVKLILNKQSAKQEAEMKKANRSNKIKR